MEGWKACLTCLILNDEMNRTILVRYGRVSEFARFACDLEDNLSRDVEVVVQTHRGAELGTVLEVLKQSATAKNGHAATSNGTSHSDQNGTELPPHERILRL